MSKALKVEKPVRLDGKESQQATILYGDPQIQIEGPEHYIVFPGGRIGVARTSDGKYWAHININSPKEYNPLLDDVEHSRHARSTMIRLDSHTSGSEGIEPPAGLYHLAVLIDPEQR